MTLKRIYFNLDDPAALQQWLAARPDGTWQVLLGTDDPQADGTRAFVGVAVAEGQGLVRWLVAKLQRGELVVRASRTLDLPVGVPLSRQA